jgi:hypothetical protein
MVIEGERVMTGTRALHPSSKIGRRWFLHFAGGEAAYPDFSRRVQPCTRRQINIRKFIIGLPSTVVLAGMRQDGTVIAARRVSVDSSPLDNASLNGIATSTDGTTIYVTFTGPGGTQGGVLALPAF